MRKEATILIYIIGLPSLQFSKLCLMVGAKIITLFDVVLNVCKENYIINGEGERMKREVYSIIH